MTKHQNPNNTEIPISKKVPIGTWNLKLGTSSSLVRRGFTLIELLVVISIIALLSTVILAALSTARQGARDADRINSIRQMQTALELYYSDDETYPDGDGAGDGGWDTPGNGTFVEVLNTNRLLSGAITDPLSDDSAGNFRYFRFPAGSFGCPATNGAFYVLGIADMETSDGEHHLSPGWSCPSRDFQEEMEYVVGKYEQ